MLCVSKIHCKSSIARVEKTGSLCFLECVENNCICVVRNGVGGKMAGDVMHVGAACRNLL